jgi:hypothetical protein
MKKLELKQMEQISASGWGTLACRLGFGGAGFLLGGPLGAMIGGTVGNILCYPVKAN